MRGQRYLGLVAVLGAAMALGGCEGVRNSLGLGKNAPDEFQVVSRAPLSLPPDYNLRPPAPGTPRPQEGTARDQAEDVVFGSSSQPATGESVPTAAPTIPVESGTLDVFDIPTLGSMAVPNPEQSGETPAPVAAESAPRMPIVGRSAGEAALLKHSGATASDPTIRQTVDQESKEIQEADTRLLDRLIFWQDAQQPGVIVDPVKERQRLQENAALGKPVTEGETPVIERRSRALLEGIF